MSVAELHETAFGLGQVVAHARATHPPSRIAVYVIGQHADNSVLAALRAAFSVVLVVADALTAATVLRELGDVAVPAGEVLAPVTPLPGMDVGVAEPPDARAGPELCVDLNRHEVTWDGRRLDVTRREREILHCLAQTPGRVWSHRELHERAWGGAYLGDPSLVHSALKRLRRKLREAGVGCAIESVRGVGFRFAVAPALQAP